MGVILILCCIYCCACKPACADARRKLNHRQITRDEEDIEQERQNKQTELHTTIAANEQTRNEIRNKYQLK